MGELMPDHAGNLLAAQPLQQPGGRCDGGVLRFSVTRVQDATFDTLRKALINFNHAAQGAEMAVVYYAGHGMEIGGTNWLIPVDAELRSDRDADKEAVSLTAITASVAEAHFGLVILDACRNNPFAAKMERKSVERVVTRGLARVNPRRNLLVAYAARDGTVASDGTGRNSPFSSALLRHLETPGLEIDLLFRRVRDQVMGDTRGEQQPFVYGMLSKEAIYLRPALASSASPSAPASSSSVAWHRGQVTECDRLAASPSDIDRPAGVAGAELLKVKLNAIAALSACDTAMREHPDIARFYFQAGRVAYSISNFTRAQELFGKASALGSSAAIYNMGVLFIDGSGVAKDPGQAKAWFERSAALGHKGAMAALGNLYYRGDGVGVDDAQARHWFEQAAAGGDPVGMNSLGVLYEMGRGVVQDYAAARAWYEKSAIRGNELGMRNLGSLHQRGLGGPKDLDKARIWYEQAATAGDQEAKNRLRNLK